jgi:ubiquinone/menaquinone biosynthesis C-methylase UbiE
MDYVLKHSNEFERLEKQSLLPNYNYKKELKNFSANTGDLVLDACCGTGLVTRYLSKEFPDAHFIGCDIGTENLDRAREISKIECLQNLSFVKEDVTNLSFKKNTFDHIVCRYAIQHLPKERRGLGISEFLRVLKPGGTLTLIDFDGTLYNLFPVSEFLTSSFSTLKEQNTIDLHIGRKLPHMAKKEGFSNVEFQIECLSFMENGLAEEVEQLRMRFENAKDFLQSSLGGELQYKRFEKEFFECLTSSGATYFYNKFIVVCKK